MSLMRRLSLNPGDLVKNRLGVEIVLSSKPSTWSTLDSRYYAIDKCQTSQDEVYVGVMRSNDIALVVSIIGSGAAQSIYVVTPHGSGWIASAEVEAVAVIAR